EDIIHGDTYYPAGAKVLEAGCGVGAQTRLLIKRCPNIGLTCIDISESQLETAKNLKSQPGFENVTFQQENIHALSFADETFDHIFVCFVAEHLDDSSSNVPSNQAAHWRSSKAITAHASGTLKRPNPSKPGTA
ncbi:MAG: class I SAM-dependent methyltransferase, partial [Planctomycetota bacterium]